jgi:hypothetical protein
MDSDDKDSQGRARGAQGSEEEGVVVDGVRHRHLGDHAQRKVRVEVKGFPSRRYAN